ncbi:MAG TPA: histidine--tRNA ligase [Gemmatimonadota bacterium]|nr:histidine--tRNA ligase [Gemmatimonadota bacterium]
MSRVDVLKGMRDHYPEEMRVRRWIEERWRETALRFGFEEYDAPALEALDLYTRKSGDEIVGQLYAFEDKGGRQVALRPEMTPSLARMVAARGPALPKPIKWFSIPRLFRYERPQRGRFREFWQLNLDIVGVAGVEADAEIMAAGVEVLRACGLEESDFVVRWSDRRLLEAVMEALGIPAGGRPAAYAGLDKLLRAGQETAIAELRKAGIEAGAAETLARAVGRRDLAGLRTELESVGVELDGELERLERLESYLEAYGIRPFCQFDAAIVRGLAYYTGVVFEMFDRSGELRALCGGGRFDDLLRAAGGEDLPAVGFGLGEAVLLELLTERDRLPRPAADLDAFVIPVTAGDRPAAIRTATVLRGAGLRTDLSLKDQAVGKGLKRADQAGARAAVVIGSAEREGGVVTVKDLRSGAETKLESDRLASWLRNRRDD